MKRLTKKLERDAVKTISKIQRKKYDYKINRKDMTFYPTHEYVTTYLLTLEDDGDIDDCIIEESVVRQVNPDYSPKSEWEHLSNEGHYFDYAYLITMVNHLVEDGDEIYYEKRETLKGHHTRAPSKKRTSAVRVNVRKMF